MEPISPDELFFSPLDEGSPGAQVHLYRLLHMLATQGASGTDSMPVSYPGAKKIAARLGINSSQRLTKLFKYMGFGELTIEIEPGHLRATVAAEDNSQLLAAGERGVDDSRRHLCEFQRGLIDGSLQLICEIPVATSETKCCTRGDRYCVFEAFRSETSDTQGYAPAGMGGISMSAPSHTSSTAKGMRSWFMELAGRELSRAKRHNRRLSLLYVDIDDLGGVNAAYGRSAGDEIISATGSAISRTCRTEDFLWHHGEDEFAIILSETDATTAARVADRLAVQIRLAAELIDASTALSACIGFATYPDDAQTVFDLFKNAKSALYLAKATGKGEVHSAEDLPGKISGRVASERLRDAESTAGKDDFPLRGDPLKQNAASIETERPSREKAPEFETAAVAAPSEVDDHPGGERNYSVVIASASHLILAGMKHELEAVKGIDVTGEFARAGGLLPFIDDVRPDMILVDARMAVADDFALPRFVGEQNLPCKIIVIVEEADQDIVKLAADFKVEGMIMQSSSPSELLSSLDTVFEGRVVMPDKIRSTLSELESSRRVLGELSDRELEVLRLVADGKSNSQISDELFITVNTVRFHLANIYQKLSVSNRTEAANYYLKQDIPPEDQARLL